MAATSSRQLKNICVLFGFRYEKYKKFVQATIDLGRAIAERKLHLVYGGSDRGLSKLVSKAAFIRGSQVLCIIPKTFKPLGCLPNPPTGEKLVVSGMQERISEILNLKSCGRFHFPTRRSCNFKGANYICFLGLFEYSSKTHRFVKC